MDRRCFLHIPLLAAVAVWTPHVNAAPAAMVDPYSLFPPAAEGNIGAGPSSLPQDQILAQSVEARLAHNARLQDSIITVHADSQTVTLTGTASSADAASEAGSDAEKVAGVRAVTNLLAVDPTAAAVGAPIDRTADYAGANPAASDLALTARAKQALLDASPVYGYELTVQAHHGIVSLSGTLDDPAAVPRVRQVVSRVDGVLGVDTSALEGGSS